MIRRVFPRSVRGRLLVVVAIVVGGALAAMTLGFNLLLARSLDGDATQLASSRASAVLSTVHVEHGRVVLSEAPDDASIDSRSWIFHGSRAIESPRTTAAATEAARSLAVTGRNTLDLGDLRLAALAVTQHGTRYGTVVAGVSLAPYEQTRQTALIFSSALAVLLFAVVLLVARSLLSHALRPVAVMTRAAAAWGAEESDRRFDLGPPHDELTQLASTLDSLLDRLAASLRHERLFSAELSHELRTPLARVLAQSEMMLARDRTTSDYRDALEHIRESATQMTRTVETLVSEARLQAAGPRGSCQIAGVIATVVAASRESARAHGSQIELGPTQPDLLVGASADLVERIIQPIVENAYSYGSTHVQISTASRGGSRVQVRVSDDGVGISDDERERIFDPGFRGRAGRRNQRGAGLGLALARRLATSAGATIEAPPSSEGGLVMVEFPAT
jgi:signal transduction histidine kinase